MFCNGMSWECCTRTFYMITLVLQLIMTSLKYRPNKKTYFYVQNNMLATADCNAIININDFLEVALSRLRKLFMLAQR